MGEAAFTQDAPAWVRPFLGIAYRELDCWKLAERVCLEGPPLVGRAPIVLPDFSEDFAHTADETLWARRLQGVVDRVVTTEKEVWPQVDEPEAFDLALYRVRGRWHVATVVGGGWAVNTNLRRGSHPILLRESCWTPLLEGYYRAP